jgi:hypothetical protein
MQPSCLPAARTPNTTHKHTSGRSLTPKLTYTLGHSPHKTQKLPGKLQHIICSRAQHLSQPMTARGRPMHTPGGPGESLIGPTRHSCLTLHKTDGRSAAPVPAIRAVFPQWTHFRHARHHNTPSHPSFGHGTQLQPECSSRNCRQGRKLVYPKGSNQDAPPPAAAQ